MGKSNIAVPSIYKEVYGRAGKKIWVRTSNDFKRKTGHIELAWARVIYAQWSEEGNSLDWCLPSAHCTSLSWQSEKCNLSKIKCGKPKSIKTPPKTLKQKIENSFTVGIFKLFFPKKIFRMFNYHPVKRAQHKLNKNWWTWNKWSYFTDYGHPMKT